MERATFPGMQKGHIETLPSGSMRAVAYAGKDPMPLLDRLYAQLRACRELCDLKHLDKLDKNHACRPMAVSTVRQIHAILSGAFKAAVRWEWAVVLRGGRGSRHQRPASRR